MYISIYICACVLGVMETAGRDEKKRGCVYICACIRKTERKKQKNREEEQKLRGEERESLIEMDCWAGIQNNLTLQENSGLETDLETDFIFETDLETDYFCR